jgi:hypothetical protein
MVSRGAMDSLRSLLETGALGFERSGPGRAIAVRRRAAVEALAREGYPRGLDPVVDRAGAMPRAEAVAAWRNAKRAGCAAVEPVLLRAFRAASLFRDADGTEVDLLALTRLAGVAAVTLQDPAEWRFSGRLGVAENLEFFYHVERVAPELDACLYAGGRLSARAVAWLASASMSEATLVHYGDYDPVGLAEYGRLHEACGARVTLYQPPHLAQILRRFGKPGLLKGRNAALLAGLRARSDPSIRDVVRLLDETGCGLEQEALLAESPESGV